MSDKYPSTLLVSLADKLAKISDESVRRDIETEIRKADLDLLVKINTIAASVPSSLSPTFTVGNSTYKYGHAYSYTPAFQGFGTPSGVSFFWIRYFLSPLLFVWGKLTAGTTTAVEARAGLPILDNTTQLVSDSTLVPSIMLCGSWTRTNAVGAGGEPTVLIESGIGYLTFGYQDTGTGGLNKKTASSILSSNETASLYASVPINGWNT